jgi:hypothetical protein
VEGGFVPIYPTPHTAGPLRGKDMPDWRGIKGDESRYVRCRFCGFPCDRDRDLIIRDGSFAGKGVSYGAQQSGTYTVGGVSVTDYYYDAEAQGGCPNCHSFRYAEKKGGS